MIKAVATALVLIAGAAVVLWFGNTLNSLVLGGLIGGLAALLLSIPISLILFSYLSRRHDEQLRAEAEWAESAVSQVYEYEEIPIRAIRRGYDAQAYDEVEDEELWEGDEEEYDQPQYQQMRSLSQQASQHLPAQIAPSNRSLAPRRANYSPLPKPGTKNMPATRKDASTRRLATRHMNNPALPGYAPGSVLRHHRSAAFRAARMEKLQQYEDDVEVLPTHISRRIPSMHPDQDFIDRYEQLPRSRTSHQMPPQTPQPQRRPRVVESKPSRNDLPRYLPSESRSSLHQSSYMDDPETENLDEHYPETGSMRRRTGQFTRNPRFDEALHQTETPSGTLGRPLVRRAPYTYEDDPIRQELSQQLYPPRVRRSSRLERQQDQE